MYQAAISQELSYQDKKRTKKKMQNAQVDSFISKANDYSEPVVQIGLNDTNMLSKMINFGVKKIQISFFRALCNSSLFCKRNRKMKA